MASELRVSEVATWDVGEARLRGAREGEMKVVGRGVGVEGGVLAADIDGLGAGVEFHIGVTVLGRSGSWAFFSAEGRVHAGLGGGAV